MRRAPPERRAVRRTRRGILIAALASACSSKATGTIAISVGGEADALTRSPAVTSLAVDLIDPDGGVSSLGKVSLPASHVDLADLSQDQSGAVRVTGTDATGATRVRGASLAIDFGGLAGGTLTVFVQRTGETARMPNSLGDAREAPLATIAAGRYLLVAGGAAPARASATALYDLLTLSPLASPPTLPRAPRSLAIAVTKALVVDDQGGTLLDFADTTTADVTLPSGRSFADLAGGASVQLPDGSVYLVGATRDGPPSSSVLHMDGAGTITFASLSAPRAGAAAAYVAGRGLVVFGGSATAPGLEVLADNATSAVPTGQPEAATGASLAALDKDHLVAVWSAGNAASFLPLDFTSAAAPAAAVSATLPCSAKHIDFFGIDAKTALGVAEDGDSCAFVWDGASVAPVPLKVPRRGARAVRVPTGEIAIVGGANEVESFEPPSPALPP